MPLSARAKRMLDQSGPGLPRKRARKSTMVVYRAPKTEMKYRDFAINHNNVSTSLTRPCQLSIGSAFSNRIGNKVKVRAIEYNAFSDANSFRMDILRLKESTTTPIYTYGNLIPPSLFDKLQVTYAHTGTLINALGMHGVHRLPLGNVVHFSNTQATDVNRNEIVAYFMTEANATITGTVRVWFTDS